MIRQKLAVIKKGIKFLLGFPLTIVSLFFIFRLILLGKEEIATKISGINMLLFLLGICFMMLFFFFRSFVWKELLRLEGYIINFRTSTFLLANSEIKRYIPGSIIGFASRVNNFNSLRVPPRAVLKLILYESILFVITCAVIAIPGAMYFFPNFKLLIALFFAIIAIVGLPYFIKNFHFLKRFESSFIFMMCAWIFYGLSNYLISTSFFFIDPLKIGQLSSYFVLSWLVGYLAIVFPMGLGVREGAVAVGLSKIMPLSIAASLAIATRVIFVISELMFLSISYAVYKLVKPKIQVAAHSLILWSSIISYALYFSYYSFQKHANFFTGRFDLGNMDQTVWNTLQGRIFQLTNPDGTEIVSRLAAHADFILILLTPLYFLWEDPRMLLLIQTVVLSIGAYFVYLIANHVLKNNAISTVFGISFLLNPFVQKQNLFDFHAVVLATTFLLASFYFMLIGRYKTFLLFLLLAVLTKENVFVIASIFGLYLFFQTRKKRWLLLTLSSSALFYVLVAKVIPWARGGHHIAIGYFSEFGETPPEILLNIITNPLKTLAAIFAPSSISYLHKLFIPLGFLSLFSPLILIFVLPDLIINLLSENKNLIDLTFHYAATIIPFIYISAIYGLKRLLHFGHKFITPKIAIYFILIFSIYSTYRYGVLPGSENPSLDIYNNYLPQRNEIRNFIKKIPQELSVASTNNLGAHLAHRTLLYTIPHGLYDSDVVLFLLNDDFASPSLDAQQEFANNFINNPSYIELYRIGDFIAFAKRSAAGKILPPY